MKSFILSQTDYINATENRADISIRSENVSVGGKKDVTYWKTASSDPGRRNC